MKGGRREKRGREKKREGGRNRKKIRARSARRSKEGGGRQGAGRGGKGRGGGRGIPSVHPLIPLGNAENLKMLFSDMYILKIPVGGEGSRPPQKII